VPGVHVCALSPSAPDPGVDSWKKGLDEPRLSGFDPGEAIAGRD
jgi:hypothetical protein